MGKRAALAFLVILSSIACAEDVAFTKNLGLFDSTSAPVTISLAEAAVSGGHILVGSSEYDETCFEAQVAGDELTITYVPTCQTCGTGNVRVGTTVELGKVAEFRFGASCAADTVFVSIGDAGKDVGDAIAEYAASVAASSERVKYLNLLNTKALSEGTNEPFKALASAPNPADKDYEKKMLEYAKAVRDGRITYVKYKLMGYGAGRTRAGAATGGKFSDGKTKTLIIIGNPLPANAEAATRSPAIKEDWFPYFKKKFAGDAKEGAWFFDVPVDRRYDAEWDAETGGDSAAGDFGKNEYMVVSRVPGFPENPALSAEIIADFAAASENGAVEAAAAPVMIVDASGGEDDYLRQQADAYAERFFPAAELPCSVPREPNSCDFLLAPSACKEAADGGGNGECEYEWLLATIRNRGAAYLIGHGNGEKLAAVSISDAGTKQYIVLDSSLKAEFSALEADLAGVKAKAPLVVAGAECMGNSLDCRYYRKDENTQSECASLAPYANGTDESIARALMASGTLLSIGHARGYKVDYYERDEFGKTVLKSYDVPDVAGEMLLYSGETGATLGEAFNRVNAGYLAAKYSEYCKAQVRKSGIGDKDFAELELCNPAFIGARHGAALRHNAFGTNLLGIPKIRLKR